MSVLRSMLATAAIVMLAPASPVRADDEAEVPPERHATHVNGTPAPVVVPEPRDDGSARKGITVSVDVLGLLVTTASVVTGKGFTEGGCSSLMMPGFTGYFGAGFAFRATDHLAIDVSTTIFHNSVNCGDTLYGKNGTAYEVTAGARGFLRAAGDGPFVEPGALVRGHSYTQMFASDSSQSWVGLELLVGWRWTIGPALDVAAAVGPAVHLTGTIAPDLDGYLRLGWSF